MAAVDPANLNWYLSGGAENSSAAASLGGVISSTEVTADALFDDVTGDQASSGHTDYRCIYIKNEDADTLSTSVLWIQSNTASADTAITIGLDLAGVSATADTIADENTAPDPAVTFVTAVDKANGLAVGNLAQNAYYGIWIKRTVSASAAAYANDGFTLRVKGDTE